MPEEFWDGDWLAVEGFQRRNSTDNEEVDGNGNSDASLSVGKEGSFPQAHNPTTQARTSFATKCAPRTPNMPAPEHSPAPSSFGDTVLPSVTTSPQPNPSYERREPGEGATPNNVPKATTPPASHADGPDGCVGAMERQEPLLKCPFLKRLGHRRQPHPHHAMLLAGAERLDSLVGTEDITEYYRWKGFESSPTRPSSVDSSNPSSHPEHVGYLCPGVSDDTRQSTTLGRGATGRFGCPMCGKKCSRKDDLRKHLQARNSPTKYPCRVGPCRKVLYRMDKYREHVRTKHGHLHYDNESLSSAAIPKAQAFPKQCLHCTKLLQNFEDWFEHWLSIHNDDPDAAPRIGPGHLGAGHNLFAGGHPATSDVANREHPLLRYVEAPDRLTKSLTTGVNDQAFAHEALRRSTDQWVREAGGDR